MQHVSAYVARLRDDHAVGRARQENYSECSAASEAAAAAGCSGTQCHSVPVMNSNHASG
jgi:hypothetical protein